MLWSFLDPRIQVLSLFSFPFLPPAITSFFPLLSSTLLPSPLPSLLSPSQLCFSGAKLQFLRESGVMLLFLLSLKEHLPPPPPPLPPAPRLHNYFLGAVTEKGNEEQKRQSKTSGLADRKTSDTSAFT